jgi:hypothetical protein
VDRATLTPDEFREILRGLAKQYGSQSELARRIGVNYKTLCGLIGAGNPGIKLHRVLEHARIVEKVSSLRGNLP